MQVIRYGSQALALKYLGIPFEHHFICEFDKYAVQSYNEIHGTKFVPTDIRDIHADDMNITETGKYKYLLTYSFPCTDLSLAGKRAGMERESGTSSSLLWEVERLLKECKELPQYLLMENVPQVVSNDNIKLFSEWTSFLARLGYENQYSFLNAKDFGVPQNRNRCFMVSILRSEHKIFRFPDKTPLKRKLKDVLEKDVDEKYYIRNEKAYKLLRQLHERGELPGVPISGVCLKGMSGDNEKLGAEPIDIAGTLCARDYKGPNNYGYNGVIETGHVNKLGNIYGRDKSSCFSGNVFDTDGIAPTIDTGQGGSRTPLTLDIIKLGQMDNTIDNTFESANRVYSSDGIAPTLPTCGGGNLQPKIVASRGRNPHNPSDRKTDNLEQRLEVQHDGLSNTLTSFQKDNYVLESSLVSGIGEKKSNNGTQYYTQDRVYDSNSVAMAHLAQIPGGSYKYMVEDEMCYAIRKLTPTECFRLMGVKDEDIAKITVSNTQKYKQSGNSIVVDVLMAIFENMFIRECKSGRLF